MGTTPPTPPKNRSERTTIILIWFLYSSLLSGIKNTPNRRTQVTTAVIPDSREFLDSLDFSLFSSAEAASENLEKAWFVQSTKLVLAVTGRRGAEPAAEDLPCGRLGEEPTKNLARGALSVDALFEWP